MTDNRIGLIGPGRLGLCVALLLEQQGYPVTAIEQNQGYLAALQAKNLDSPEPEVNKLLSASKIIRFSSDLQACLTDDHDLIFIYVPTPENDRGYDHSILMEVLKNIMSHGRRKVPVTLVVGCTTLPGFNQTIDSQLESLNYHLVYSPAFIAQGTIIKNLQHPDMLLFGTSEKKYALRAEKIVNQLTHNNPKAHHMSLISAEITKLATNCFLTAKIAFANAIGDLASQSGADQKVILEAIGSDSRVGHKYLSYGYGFGGPCFPRDNRALNYFARETGYTLQISEATERANEQHTDFQIAQLLQTTSQQEEIYFDHVTYKPGTDILQESQQLKIALALAKEGRTIKVSGSHKVVQVLKDNYGDLFIYEVKN
ncbi:nucleotide sugar dehydrogenase [Marinoscillum sp.]|uniref:nucleotide sugar dehydrogenase n=1 Tax=Marinoscillum sp. TaxID=2024838 RepID=UPI003BA915AF